MQAVFLLPANHLYPPAHLQAWRGVPIVMVEDETLCRRYRYHKQKLAMVLAAMREHAQALGKAGHEVRYAPLSAQTSMLNHVADVAHAAGATTLLTFTVTDHGLRKRLADLAAAEKLEWREVADPGFITSKPEFEAFAAGKKSVRMADFYRLQRRRLDLLLDVNGDPLGGRWSFDEMNRRKVPKRQALPGLPTVGHSELTRAAFREVEERFAGNPGEAAGLWLPVTRRGALAWLNRFLEERLVGFGTYEDAMTERSATLFHSTLSPLLNLGLITPAEVLARTLEFAENRSVPLNDLEGFVRQLVGWREFVRGVYDSYPHLGRSNVRRHSRRLTPHWHRGDTGLAPLDLAIANHKAWAWNHHIERLMVVSNLMNLCGVHPREVYDYFMTHYVDAHPWVMAPNVFGMGMTSDGGVFATKPYICGANYILKMSDYARGPWCDVMDGLYWRFIENNREELRRNPRLAAMASGVDRLDGARRERIFAAADDFVRRCTVTAAG